MLVLSTAGTAQHGIIEPLSCVARFNATYPELGISAASFGRQSRLHADCAMEESSRREFLGRQAAWRVNLSCRLTLPPRV